MTRLLLVSNGYGEDLIAAEIARQVRGAEMVAYPLVGLGDAYPPEIIRLDPRRTFRSGGFALRTGMRGLGADLRSGLFRFWLSQRRTLRAQRGRVALSLVVGDPYALAMARLAGAEAVLVATADSVTIRPYGRVNLSLVRRARLVLTRDAASMEALRRHGINASYLGLTSLDYLRFMGTDFGLALQEEVVTVLPGSRGDAVANAALLTRVARRIVEARPGTRFLMPLASTVDQEAVRRAIDAPIILTDAFADAVNRAAVILGLAGTANEQAAALGKPVVAFPGPGVQFTPRFLADQKRLLGEALVAAASPEEAGDAVVRLLAHPEERQRRGRAGTERLGGPGATKRIAALLGQFLSDGS